MPDYDQCRMYGHHWDSKEVSWDAVHYWDRLECEVCGAQRTDQIRKRTGKTKVRSYKYPQNYKQEVKMTRAEIKKGHFDASYNQG